MKNKKRVLVVVLIAALVACMALAYNKFREKPVEGSKEITIEVVDSEEKSTVYELKTDVEYLKEAMDELEKEGLTYDGEETEYGFSVYTVNGETADFNVDASYWSFYVNEEYCNYGVSEQPVEDGDAFAIVYTVYEE